MMNVQNKWMRQLVGFWVLLISLLLGMSLSGLAVAADVGPHAVPVDQINAANTSWMLTSTVLVLMMTVPGLALFYAGMVRKKNVLATTLQSFVICAIATLVWVVVGYSLAFTSNNAFIGGLDRIFLDGMFFDNVKGMFSVSHVAPNIPEPLWVMFQLIFAVITPALITGAFAERMRFRAMAA